MLIIRVLLSGLATSAFALTTTLFAKGNDTGDSATKLFELHCYDCHSEGTTEGGIDLKGLLGQKEFDGSLVFENLITGKMPPDAEDAPNPKDKMEMLTWLAGIQKPGETKNYRRISRRELNDSLNDLLGVELDLVDQMPDDRGTYRFSTDRRILLTRESLSARLEVIDQMLEFALPENGFPKPQEWQTTEIKDSHPTYKVYTQPHEDGILFSWTRANNGNSYSFFFDGFEPPVAGWYQLTFDAAKLGEFPEDISLQVYAGKYYFADDRPQPQRLLDVISLGERKLNSYSIRAFLQPGENISVHCYSEHTWRRKDGKAGAFIKQLKVRGPLTGRWPPRSVEQLLPNLLMHFDPRLENEPRPLQSAAKTRPATNNGPVSELNRLKLVVENGNRKQLTDRIRQFAQRAFVADVTDQEIESVLKQCLASYDDDGDFVAAFKIGVKSILASHRFQLSPGIHRDRHFSIAASLASILWQSIPDKTLLQLAHDRKLTSERIRQEANRLVDDDRFHRMVRTLVSEWLRTQEIRKVSPSLKLYPEYDELLERSLVQETEAYLHFLITENYPVSYLIDSDFTFLNQRLARHYGIESVLGQQFRKVRLSKDSKRGGLLTMGSVLTVTADGFQTSPILRGAWISKNIVGNTLAPPPKGVEAIESDTSSAKSIREQIQLHKQSENCRSCHKKIDPYGFALESFDATGAERRRYRIKLPHRGTFQYRREGYFKAGQPVDSAGQIDDHKFEDIIGLKKLLSEKHHLIAYNFAKTFFEFVNGAEPSLTERLTLYQMISRENSCRLKELMIDIILLSVDTPDSNDQLGKQE